MRMPGCDLEPIPSAKNEIMMVDFQRQFAFKNQEELASMKVRMSRLARARGHQLFDHAEVRRLDQVPAIAVCSVRTSPLVMFSGSRVHDQSGISIKTFARVYGMGGMRSGGTWRKPMDS
jgi:hypothetical protein